MSNNGDQDGSGECYAEELLDDTAHRACYVYAPPTADHNIDQSPSKRRKTKHVTTDREDSGKYFAAVLGGKEATEHTDTRESAFRKCWMETSSCLAHFLEPVDNVFLDRIVQFVRDASISSHHGRLPTGLIYCGPKSGSQTRLMEKWKSMEPQDKTAVVVSIDAAQATNLMAALKILIRAAITQTDGTDGYQRFLNEHRHRICMNYDLELLHEFVSLMGIQKCVIFLTDIEGFDIGLLADLILAVSSWKDRIPFVLLLGISTTVELFEARLSKKIVHLLDCKLFDASVGADPCLEMYRNLRNESDASLPAFGPVVTAALFEMSREQDASATGFSRAIKYAIMSHYFANALSTLLDPNDGPQDTNRALCEAIRSTGSFREYAEEKLSNGGLETVRSLLGDDKALLRAAREGVKKGQKAMRRHQKAVELFELILNLINLPEPQLDSFSIRLQALSGNSFLDSTLYKDLISSITTLPSNQMRKLLSTIQQHCNLSSFDIDTLLKRLDQAVPPTTRIPLRSAYDPTHTTTSTTIANNKVSLAKHRPKLSAAETAYTKLVDQVADRLSAHFEQHILDPTTLFLHEAFLYNLRTPLATVFTPRPRYATERALSVPQDYLGCECCEDRAEGQIAASQPPSCVLWQLWCEAGGIVNVRDLWSAFEAIVVEKNDAEEQSELDEEEEREGRGRESLGGEVATSRVNERMALALFYRGLAELRMMGFVKPTKRKADCLAKTVWKGM